MDHIDTTAKYPTVSVVIPTHNRIQMLRRAVSSVLSQSYRNIIECIIVDDASSVDVKAAVEMFGDDRLLYVRNERCIRAPATRNRGLKLAKGELVALLDDDDEWYPEKIEKQVSRFQEVPETVGLVYCGFEYVPDGLTGLGPRAMPKLRGNVYLPMLGGCIIGSPTPLMRRECFERAGYFDESLKSCQDWELWMRLSRYYEFDFVPEVLARHHVHGAQISTNLKAKLKSREAILRKHRQEIQGKPKISGRHLNNIGVLYCLLGDYPNGRRYFQNSVKENRLQLEAYFHLLVMRKPSLYKKILNKYFTTNIGSVRFYYY